MASHDVLDSLHTRIPPYARVDLNRGCGEGGGDTQHSQDLNIEHRILTTIASDKVLISLIISPLQSDMPYKPTPDNI